MKLIKKNLEKYGRSMYLYFPKGEPRSAVKRCSITILREEDTRESVQELLDGGLAEFAEEKNLILSFPNPAAGSWNYNLSKQWEDDVEIIQAMQDALGTDRELEPAEPYFGIPTYEMMINTWHPMNDTRYFVGIGNGASMVYTLAACRPEMVTAIMGIGGELSVQAIKNALYEPVPAWLIKAKAGVAEYLKKANATGEQEDKEGYYRNDINPLQCVKETEEAPGLAGDPKRISALIEEAYLTLFSRVRKPNTGDRGDCESRMVMEKEGFEIFLEDDRLQDGMLHSWYTHVPAMLRETTKKVPLMIFMHGGSDNPEEAAEMSKFHELGEAEGFITVYPWAGNKAGWNMKLLSSDEENKDDVAYITALIDYMINNYPVDEQRVYLSGFSNGAGMAQTVAMLHPEKVAAICHIDSNWPGDRLGAAEFDPELEPPFSLALSKQKSFPFRMPVWYTYGTREPSYPVYYKCSQQHQYDFWKRYNNIKIEPTPGAEAPHPRGCGVEGSKTEILKPCSIHPGHQYDVHRFFTEDDGHENLYNFVLMRDKGHDIARMDPVLGWNYVKQFKRRPDGSVVRIEN